MSLKNARKTHEIFKALGDRLQITRALNNLGLLAQVAGDTTAARRYHEKAYAIREEMKDREGMASSLVNLANLEMEAQRYDDALAHFEKALALSKTTGNTLYIAAAYAGLADVHYETEAYDKALDYIQKAFEIYKALDAPRSMSSALKMTGDIIYRRNPDDFEQAREAYERALRIASAQGLKPNVLNVLRSLARVLIDQKKYRQALAFLICARQECAPGAIEAIDEQIKVIQAKMPPQRFEASVAQARKMQLDDLVQQLIGEAKPNE